MSKNTAAVRPSLPKPYLNVRGHVRANGLRGVRVKRRCGDDGYRPDTLRDGIGVEVTQRGCQPTHMRMLSPVLTSDGADK